MKVHKNAVECDITIKPVSEKIEKFRSVEVGQSSGRHSDRPSLLRLQLVALQQIAAFFLKRSSAKALKKKKLAPISALPMITACAR